MIHKNTERIINELKKLQKQHSGLLKPTVVVDAARDKKSILHDCFEWDDSIAAEKYRIEQARDMLQVYVVYNNIPSTEPCRVFVSLTSDRKDGGYRELITVMNDAEMRRELLSDAMKDIDIFTKKYQMLEELAQVFDAMKTTKSKFSLTAIAAQKSLA